VNPAALSVVVHKEPDGPYERTQRVSVEFAILYPDSSPVVTVKEGIKPVAFYAGQIKRADLGLAGTDTTSRVWFAERKIQANATLGTEYRFVFGTNAFDDGYGNVGPDKDAQTGNFTVVSASLQVTVAANSTRYQVPLDAMTAYVQANYPDGQSLANATLQAWLSARESKRNATVTYDKEHAVWIVKYRFSLLDVTKLGVWTLSLEVRDTYGNAGFKSLEIIAEPYYFVAILLVTVTALLVGRWILSKYWIRLFIRAKRLVSAIKGLQRRRSPRHY
jgi:hypothetical protein